VKHGDRIPRADGPRPFSELIETGLLWYLNRVAFHPRGFAIGLCVDDGEIVGWELHGDGTEPWSFNEEVDDAKFAAAEATFDAAKATQQLEEDMRTVFAPKQLPDYAAYKKLTDPPPAFPDSIAEALEELRRKVWAAGYPVGEITIGTTTDYETNKVTLFAEADVIPWPAEVDPADRILSTECACDYCKFLRKGES